MNRLQSSAKKNAVEVLTEDLLWAKGLLGGETPNMLLDTVVSTMVCTSHYAVGESIAY